MWVWCGVDSSMLPVLLRIGIITGFGITDMLFQADSRFTEDQLQDILARITAVFDEEEASIPGGVEDEVLPKIENKLLGAAKKKKKAKRRVA